MNEMQHECYLLGIPLRTRHREVAPNQVRCSSYCSSLTHSVVADDLTAALAHSVIAYGRSRRYLPTLRQCVW